MNPIEILYHFRLINGFKNNGVKVVDLEIMKIKDETNKYLVSALLKAKDNIIVEDVFPNLHSMKEYWTVYDLTSWNEINDLWYLKFNLETLGHNPNIKRDIKNPFDILSELNLTNDIMIDSWEIYNIWIRQGLLIDYYDIVIDFYYNRDKSKDINDIVAYFQDLTFGMKNWFIEKIYSDENENDTYSIIIRVKTF